jgi:hypothetical protein
VSEIKTKPLTEEYAEGFDRSFGARVRVQGGRFLYRPGHPQANERGFVPAHLVDQPVAHGVEISVDRNYENLRTSDGVTINSRRQHRDYMKANGVTHMSDFKGVWDKAAQERSKVAQGEHDVKARREEVGRAVYELQKKGRR